jgi:hypothetical protein
MLIEQLEQVGYHAEITAKSRYMKGLIPLLGGQYTLNVLQHDYILRLLSNAQIRNTDSTSRPLAISYLDPTG